MDSMRSQMSGPPPRTRSNWTAVSGSMGALPTIISLINLADSSAKTGKLGLRDTLGFQLFFKDPSGRDGIVRVVLVGGCNHF